MKLDRLQLLKPYYLQQEAIFMQKLQQGWILSRHAVCLKSSKVGMCCTVAAKKVLFI